MTLRGLGDRWLAGEPIDGVAFAHHAPVQVVEGSRAGARGIVLLLMSVEPEPRYLVQLRSGEQVPIRESALRAAAP